MIVQIEDDLDLSKIAESGQCFRAVSTAGRIRFITGEKVLYIEPLGEGSSLLDFFDFISNSVIMPIVALLTCIFVGWIIKPQTLVDEIELTGPFKLKTAWTVMIKYVAPVLVVVILVAYVAAQFGLFVM